MYDNIATTKIISVKKETWQFPAKDYVIDDETIRRIEEFALVLFNKGHCEYQHNQRGGASPLKIMEDHKIGKIGEFVTWKFLQEELNLFYDPPDLTIYDKKNKSWDLDLQDIHVKTAATPYKDQWSWIVQWQNQNGIGGKDKEILNKQSDSWTSLVVLDKSKNYKSGKVASLIRTSLLPLREPFKASLQDTKKAVYLSDVCDLFDRRQGE